MDTRRVLPLLLLVICTINAAFSIHNDRGRPNNVRRVRRISEYLVPPPPPRFHPGRVPRLADYQSTSEEGYFSKMMSWLNPFNWMTRESPPPLRPPLTLQQSETAYSPTFVQPAPAAAYNGPVAYETPPLPPAPIDDQPGYPTETRTKNCNPCNKTPWTPIPQDELAHSGDASSAVSLSVNSPDTPMVGGYISTDAEAPRDAYHAASYDVRVPDYSYPTPVVGEQAVPLAPLPNPTVYIEETPPLYKEGDFHDYYAQVAPNGNPYPDAKTSSSVAENGAPTGGSFLNAAGSAFNGGYNEPLYPTPSDYSGPGVVPQEPEYTNPGVSNEKLEQFRQDHAAHDLSSSGTQVSSNTNVAKGFSENIEDSINFVESPLLDFTYKDESRTDSSSIPPTSNTFADFETTENAGTTVAFGDEIFGTRQNPLTEFSVDYYETTDAVESTTSAGAVTEPFEATTTGQQNGKRKQVHQLVIPYMAQHTPVPFRPLNKTKISDTDRFNHDNYVGEESKTSINVVRPNSPIFPQSTTSPIFGDKNPANTKANNSINVHKLQKNIDNWTIQNYSKTTPASTVPPRQWTTLYISSPSKPIPKEYLTATKLVSRITDSSNDNVKTYTLDGLNFNDQKYEKSANHRMEQQQTRVLKSSIYATTSGQKNVWRNFPTAISAVNKEIVQIVTPVPLTTPRLNSGNRKQMLLKEAESNTKESKETSQTNMKETKNTFEPIEKVYQVLPQAVNNLAVASTGPESVTLWSIMEHEDFASLADSEYDSNDTEPPIPYSRSSKKSRAKR
ncbi:PREDICTED: flocculation protein FLO11-like [Vollenhovia emeryi]|uniref:flocculation protein FLO11-like n=1 Tax=Vollenhovia emeryi TaxID=411798 RepID=UPI0005F4544A|nr:PREDICTED: flocculation protein FLO11-like [Vollenhovia emeryi]